MVKINNAERFCACGNHWRLKWYQYILLLFKDITVNCKCCGRQHCFHMTYFVNEKFTKETKLYNKTMEENKKGVVRKG